ncbi:dihydrolipoyl dehydrogenase [Sphingobium amiense]|uniref:Dihydrolipoyl dehydrogenase n=2 Tax=Sphingobium amiense TaxID=135719 RepID=A0A494W112_9SPHN|nr:dihydrolipoyl dehydrogenase [Sphingobium amiense]BBD97006.1 dihydrolipoyl dehydrogenase [Sphingobium amiense]
MYDVAIIGAGSGGYSAAIRAGQLGMKVACIEGSPHLGGTCLNIGCMPSKALLHASELYEDARLEFANLGIDVQPKLNLEQMMAQKADSVSKLIKGVEFLFRKNHVEWIKGWASFAAPGQLDIRHLDGTTGRLEARHVVIATGSVPVDIPGVCVDHKTIVTSTEALSFSEVPRRLAIIGAGVIGLELGSVWRRLGSEVIVLEYQDRVLPEVDSEIATTFGKLIARQGVQLRLGVRVSGAVTTANGATVEFGPRDGSAVEQLECDKVLVAVGRRPFTNGLKLETIGLKTGPRGFIQNDAYRTGIPNVWVIGDVTNGPMLAHRAEDDAIACIESIAGMVDGTDHQIIPNVVYTKPEIATIGATEDHLKATGVAYRAGRFQFMANSRARINHETAGLVKVLTDEKTDRILGVHMVGPSVSEFIAEAAVAMAMGATSEDVAYTAHPHPTRSEAFRQASMDVTGWAMQA